MGGGGSKKQNTTPAGSFSWQGGGGSNFSPEEFNKTMGSDILAAYKKGPADVFDQSLYTGLSGTTQQGLSGLLNTANQNAGMFDAGIDYTQGLLSGGGLTDTQRGNLERVDTLAASAGAGNPFVQSIADQTADDTYADVMASLGGSGRTGSSVHVDELTSSLADARNRLLYQDFNDSFGRQLAANQTAFGMGQQGVANAMGATAALPGLFDASLLPSQTILGVGQARDADTQAKRLAEFEQFQRTNDPTFNHIAKYQGLLSSQAGNPQPEKQPGLFDWLGLGIAGAGVLL